MPFNVGSTTDKWMFFVIVDFIIKKMPFEKQTALKEINLLSSLIQI